MNKSSDGFAIKIATGLVQGTLVGMTEEDLSALERVNKVFRSVTMAVGSESTQVFLAGTEVHIAIQDENSLLSYTASQLAAELACTAAELVANADRDQPLLHAEALTNPKIGQVLRALSSNSGSSGAPVVLRTVDGEVEVPVLPPSVFVEPRLREELSKKIHLPVTGLIRNRSRGITALLLGSDTFRVMLPDEHPGWSWTRVRESLEVLTHFSGTIVRANGSTDWVPGPDATLHLQSAFEFAG